MQRPNDLSKSLTVLEQGSTLIAAHAGRAGAATEESGARHQEKGQARSGNAAFGEGRRRANPGCQREDQGARQRGPYRPRVERSGGQAYFSPSPQVSGSCAPSSVPAFTAPAAIGSGTCARPNPLTAAPSIAGMSLAIKGPETMTSTASSPLTKDQGAIDPFDQIAGGAN
jgi:hypothetical protein